MYDYIFKLFERQKKQDHFDFHTHCLKVPVEKLCQRGHWFITVEQTPQDQCYLELQFNLQFNLSHRVRQLLLGSIQ